MHASKNIRVRAVRAELRAAPNGLRTSSGRTVHGDRRPAGPYGPAECMNGRRPVWHGWAGPNRAPCLPPIAPWSLHPYVSRESAADRTWLVERRLLLKVMTGPSRSMYGTTRVSKRRLNSTVDERGGARHANPRFTAVALRRLRWWAGAAPPKPTTADDGGSAACPLTGDLRTTRGGSPGPGGGRGGAVVALLY